MTGAMTARSKTAPKRRAPLRDPEPSLVVIGEAPFVGELNAVLIQRFGMLTHEPDVGAAIAAVTPLTAAVLLVSSLERRGDASKLEAACRVIRAEPRLESVHVLGVVPERTSETMVRRLYRADIHAVVEWPSERETLTDFLIELLAVDPGKKKMSTFDSALTRTTQTKLAAIGARAEHLAANVRDGVAYLSGRVASLQRRDEIEEEVTHIPGLRHVLGRDIAVAARANDNAKLARSVRQFVSLVGEPDNTSVSVSVRDGSVRLSGFVSGGADRQRLDWMVRNVDGVRAFENRVRVASGGSKTQRLISRKIAGRVADRFPESQVEARTFGRVVELRGTVRRLAERRAIETFAESISGVERVVNKLIVRRDDSA